MAHSKTPHETMTPTLDPTAPPRPALSTCLGCGAGVLLRVWHPQRGWTEAQTPWRSPITGEGHRCHVLIERGRREG